MQFSMGLRLIPSEMAVERRTEFKVTAWATRNKKRKNWRVMRVEIERPCMYVSGGTLFAHPSLIRDLRKAT